MKKISKMSEAELDQMLSLAYTAAKYVTGGQIDLAVIAAKDGLVRSKADKETNEVLIALKKLFHIYNEMKISAYNATSKEQVLMILSIAQQNLERLGIKADLMAVTENGETASTIKYEDFLNSFLR